MTNRDIIRKACGFARCHNPYVAYLAVWTINKSVGITVLMARPDYYKKVQPNGKVFIRVTLEGDKKRSQTFPAKTPKAVIDKWAMGQKADYFRGLMADPHKRTVSDLLEEWYENARGNWTDKTYKDNKGMMKRYVVPLIGRKNLQAVKPPDVMQVFDKMKHLSDRSITLCYTNLNAALSYAMDLEYITKNPAKNLRKRLPKGTDKKEKRILRPAELKRFLEKAKDSRFETLYKLLVSTGIRIGEALALEPKHITAKGIKVEQSLDDIASGFNVGAPKTDYSRRTVPFAKELQLSSEDKYIFSGKGVNSYQSIQKDFRKVLKAAKIESALSLHDLRHTACTLMLLDGMSPKVVSKLMGHYSVAFTLDTYAHLIPEMLEDVPERMSKIFFQPDTVQTL